MTFPFRKCALALLALGCMLEVAPVFGQSAPPSSSTPIKIGFLLDSLQVERWQTDLDDFQRRVKSLGGEVLSETAEGNDDLQYQQAIKLLDAGVKALVVVPHNTDKAVPIVVAARSKGVPVICYERLIHNANVDFFVGVDAEAIGELQAAYLARHAPQGNYVLVGGSPSDANAAILHQGQMKILQPLVDRGQIHILADTWTKDWNPLDAYNNMSTVLLSKPEPIVAVVASNDGTAGGAIQALEEHKLAGKVLVSGQDADLAAIVRILNGTQTMTIYKPLGTEAQQAADVAMSLAAGNSVRTESFIANGAKNVPAVYVKPVVVTKDNVMQTVIKDGFQNLDTIKKSVPQENWPKKSASRE